MQWKGIYRLCSCQSTKKVAVCAEKMFCLFLKQPSPQLVDDYTGNTIPFPCIEISLSWVMELCV
jgi:hypothetical protein